MTTTMNSIIVLVDPVQMMNLTNLFSNVRNLVFLNPSMAQRNFPERFGIDGYMFEQCNQQHDQERQQPVVAQYGHQQQSPFSAGPSRTQEAPAPGIYSWLQEQGQQQQQYCSRHKRLRTDDNNQQQQIYVPGMGARIISDFVRELRNKPQGDTTVFWNNLVSMFFAPRAKKRMCMAMCEGLRAIGAIPQGNWICMICQHTPPAGFELGADILARLFKLKSEDGKLGEMLYLGKPNEYQNTSGQIVLEYDKAIQSSMSQKLLVECRGDLRIVLTPDLKICSWDFCVRRYMEFLPRSMIDTQLVQLEEAANMYKSAVQTATSSSSVQALQTSRERFLTSVREFESAMGLPEVKNVGSSKINVSFLQISEVLAGKTMEKIMEYSKRTGSSPTGNKIGVWEPQNSFRKTHEGGMASPQFRWYLRCRFQCRCCC